MADDRGDPCPQSPSDGTKLMCLKLEIVMAKGVSELALSSAGEQR
jgi:hypothetical protein